jgi:hypothetical protein
MGVAPCMMPSRIARMPKKKRSHAAPKKDKEELLHSATTFWLLFALTKL